MKKIVIIVLLFTSFFAQTYGQTKEELLKKRDDLKKQIEFERQEAEKRLKQLILAPSDIKKARNVIETSNDESLKKELYRDLQKRVEYRNQLANTLDNEGEITCNITSLSEVFALMGKDISPDELNKTIKGRNALIDYENATTERDKKEALAKIEKYNICDKDIDKCLIEQEANIKAPLNKYHTDTRRRLAEDNGIKQEKCINCNLNKKNVGDESKVAKEMEEELNNGNAVMMSVGGHIVRVVDIKKDEKGNPIEFVVNDPYGKEMNFEVRKKYLENKTEKERKEKLLDEDITNINKKIKDEKNKEIIKNLSEEKQKKEKEKNKLIIDFKKQNPDNGYGCYPREDCNNKNEKSNAKSQKGKEDTWSIKDLKDSGIGIKYYEVYSPQK